MKRKLFKLFPLFEQSFSAINTDEGIIEGVSVATEGEVKGHGIFADSIFIEQVAQLGQEQPQGVKARFGHPNMCATALGTYVGRFKNYRVEGNKAVADLHLDDSAKVSPNGNLYEYVLQMAATNPDMFGTSIVFTPAESHIEEADENGENIEKEFARIESLLATDLVDEPAANDSLFTQFSDDDIAAQVTEFLDSNPKIWDVVERNPGLYDEFLGRYTEYKERKTGEITTDLSGKFEALQSWVKGKITEITGKGNTPEEVKILDNPELIEKMAAFSDVVTEANTNLANKSRALDEATNENTRLKGELSDKENEIARLSGTGAGGDNEGDEGNGTGDGDNKGGTLWDFMAKEVNTRHAKN